MVNIEAVVGEDEVRDHHQIKKENDNSSESLHSNKNEGNNNNNTGDVKLEGEGWETASEGEENNDASATFSGRSDDPFEDALTEDQQRQKALNQANDSKAEGNRLFASGDYEAALVQYASALEIAPDHPLANEVRSMCFLNSAVCYLKLGKYQETVKESTKALELNPSYLKALIRRAEAHEKLEHYDEAIGDLKKVIELDNRNEQARKSIIRLEPIAAEKREKLKEEMIGKLKDLGNSVLGRFGMSVDNFKAVKDPNTGSYSLSFQR